MNRKFCVSILIVCFGSSTVNLGWATEAIPVAPVVVQPYEVQELTQQMLNRDRVNRDEEIAIQSLVEENDKLTQETLAHQEDEGLKKINETMLSYRNALFSRDQARIMANSEQRWPSRYGDLVALTEDADNMTDYRRVLNAKNDMLAQKYQMLTDLKDEMTALNDRLRAQGVDALNQKENIIEGYKKIAQDQQEKIRMLVSRLDEMDLKISHFDEIIAQKDRQIALLKDNLARAQSEAASKDDTIKEQENQIAILQQQSKELSLKDQQIKAQADQMESLSQQANNQSAAFDRTQSEIANLKDQVQQQELDLKTKDENIRLLTQALAAAKSGVSTSGSGQNMMSVQQVQEEVQRIKNDFAQRFKNYDQYENAIASLKNQVRELSVQLSQKQEQVDLLKEELENKITELGARGSGTSGGNQPMIAMHQEQGANGKSTEVAELPPIFVQSNDYQNQEKMLENRIAELQGQRQELRSELIKEMARQHEHSAGQQASQAVLIPPVAVQPNDIAALRNKMHQQVLDLAAKDESIRWLNKVLAVAKEKADYYKLTSQEDRLSLQQAREEAQSEERILKNRISQVVQLPAVYVQSNDLQQRVNGLESQITDLKAQREELKRELAQSGNEANTEQDLKDQLQDKDNQIAKMKSDLQEILQDRANKEIYHRQDSVRLGENMKLAKQLIDLQQEEAALLQEKSTLALQEFSLLDGHVSAYESRIKVLLANHRIQNVVLRDRMQELMTGLGQKQQQVDLLKGELEEKIANEKNQDQLQMQIQDLRTELQDKEGQITTLNTEIQSGQQTQPQMDTLKQQLADQQNKIDLLKGELDNKIEESKRMSLMMEDYQKKLEAKNNAYNEQFGQVLSSKNYQAQMEKEILDLNDRLQEKEAQVVKVKKDMYDLQGSIVAKETNAQAKDLSLSIVQEKINQYQSRINELRAVSDKQVQEIKGLRTELASARQNLQGMPSSDELDFLRTGLKKATEQLSQKDRMLTQVKTNADEFAKEYKEAAQQLQSLKDQISNAQDEIDRKNEDLKYKDMAITRIKERSQAQVSDLQAQVKVLTHKLEIAQKRGAGHNPENTNEYQEKINELQAISDKQAQQVKDLEDQLAQAQQAPTGAPNVPNRNQIEFLTAGLKKANEQLKQRDEMLAQVKADADEYTREFTKQSRQFQSLKDQLSNAQEEIDRKDQDLKRKDNEIARLKGHPRKGESVVEVPSSNNAALEKKLDQALDKIDQQGRVINVLVQKLQDAGQSVNLSHITGN